jgi:CDP-diacylglycerol--glycerol-3-phosphate 3-phosphatidyltransferase
MADSSRRLIPERLQRAFMRRIAPLIDLFTRLGLSPNAFTVAGVVVTSIAAIAFFLQQPRLGGILILLGGFCDAVDGSLARNSGKASRFGALLDSSVDRYAEFAMLFGIGGYFLITRNYVNAAATFLALCGSFMVSYTRARAESLGLVGKGGMMQRPERIVFLGAGAVIHPLALEIAIWMVAVFANITALQRLRFAFKQDAAAPLQDPDDPSFKSVPAEKN